MLAAAALVKFEAPDVETIASAVSFGAPLIATAAAAAAAVAAAAAAVAVAVAVAATDEARDEILPLDPVDVPFDVALIFVVGFSCSWLDDETAEPVEFEN